MGVVKEKCELEQEITNFFSQDAEDRTINMLKNELGQFSTIYIYDSPDFTVREYSCTYFENHTSKYTTKAHEYMQIAFFLNQEILEDKINNQKNEYLPFHNYIYYTPDESNVEIYFKKNITYINLDLYVDTTFFHEFIQETKSINTFISSIDKSKFVRLVEDGIPITPQMLHILLEMKECILTGIPRQYFMKGRIMNILQLIFEWIETYKLTKIDSLTSSFKENDVKILHEIHDFILNHPKDFYTIEQLSIQFAINDFKLKKGFKELFGMGIFQFSSQIRMEQALHLLKHSDLSIKEIAYNVGYSSPSSFSVAFKKECGVSPNKIRT